MRRLPFACPLLILLLMTGCAQRSSCVSGGATSTGPTPPQPTEMQADRGKLGPDLSAVASYQAVDSALSPPTATVQYRVLRAEEVQCLAAANAPLGNLYASESEAAQTNAGRNPRAAAMVGQLMAFRAIDQRNRAAGGALELFYLLAEAEANRDILTRSIGEIDKATANLDQLKRSGLKIPLDRTTLQRQKLDWLDRQLQLRSAFSKMQGQLQQLCGFEADAATPIWPQADLAVTVAPVDMQAAISDGLANRAEFGALRMLGGSLDADTLPAARVAMQGLSPGLGGSIIARRVIGAAPDSQEELQSRQSQLSQATSDIERTIRREIAEGVETAETRLREIAVAKERSEMWRQRLESLRARRESDGVTAFDLNAAQLELLRAESDTLHRVIAWRIAQVKLKQAEGLLAAECGYRVSVCQ